MEDAGNGTDSSAHNVSFRIDRNDVNDALPEFEVRNFTFDNIPAEQALFKLTEEAGITLVAKDAPYPALYGKNLNGSFKEVVEMVSRSADCFTVMMLKQTLLF